MIWIIVLILCIGCSSSQIDTPVDYQETSLTQEYDQLSKQMDSLQNERNALLNFKVATKDFNTSILQYGKSRQEFLGLQTKNRDELDLDLPELELLELEVTPLQNIGVDEELDRLSNEIRELERKKAEVTTKKANKKK